MVFLKKYGVYVLSFILGIGLGRIDVKTLLIIFAVLASILVFILGCFLFSRDKIKSKMYFNISNIFAVIFFIIIISSSMAKLTFTIVDNANNPNLKQNITAHRKRTYPEYELVAIKITKQAETDTWGRIVNYEEYLEYSFLDSKGNLYHRNRYYEGEQKNRYRLHKSKDGKCKIVDKSTYSSASLDFYISDEMLKNLY